MTLRTTLLKLGAAASGLTASVSAFAADTLDKGDTAWMLVATVLVLFMTIPGIALFYAGMARKKNILGTIAQDFAICGVVTILWFVIGYSLAFSEGNSFIGGLSFLGMQGIGVNTLQGSIPQLLFAVFQMTFAVLTACLITGSWAGRVKFSAMLAFMVIWSLLVYAPICHWVWASDGFFFKLGALDYAGGTVVHINAGIAGLVGALMLGKRKGYGVTPMQPANLTIAVVGAAVLWVGWMGFNGGSGLAADGRAAMAIVVSQIAAAGGLVAWMAAEWAYRGKPSLLGMISGAIAGLVGITPGSGFVEPLPALAIGIAAGLVCFWSVTILKRKLGYDDALDGWGVHGVGGIVGALLTGVFATARVTGTDLPPVMTQVGIQALSVIATLVYGGLMSGVILYVIDKVMGLRVSADDEQIGLDLALHGERIE
ncbi:ammonium transporter [Sutterella sp. AF15-45LB]|jgi:Amt family ammonium transporter|uniref:Ammonium transporter n=1 Tax=Mesosutterella multiformis TaxID=2259133 RepID=A0A388SFP5_9BURK|nr:ammonium transporter [Mesosutterella multiformis]MBS5812071.1 ammonium transporter [Sutterella sp.]RGU78684.1 ammonium transporter [Sutterella sp. AF15-45LB]RGU80012.1 ammonium transporter [Sutterella sp. AF15-44LB]RHH08131.1 ammonium transporter [Sutterella sp. AM18-8-1]GBO94503.1 ammonium transporter [Mesosutterella multiformis]